MPEQTSAIVWRESQPLPHDHGPEQQCSQPQAQIQPSTQSLFAITMQMITQGKDLCGSLHHITAQRVTGDQAHKLDSGNKREQQWQWDCDSYTVEHSGGHQPFNAATA